MKLFNLPNSNFQPSKPKRKKYNLDSMISTKNQDNLIQQIKEVSQHKVSNNLADSTPDSKLENPSISNKKSKL